MPPFATRLAAAVTAPAWFAFLSISLASHLSAMPASSQTLECTNYEQYTYCARDSRQAFNCMTAGEWYLYGAGHGTLRVLDIHKRSEPRLVGSVGVGSDEESALALGDQLVCLTNPNWSTSNSILTVIDVSAPTSPQVLGSTAVPDLAHFIDIAGSSAVLLADSPSGSSSSLHVVDLSNPGVPAIQGSLNLNVSPAGGLAVVGSYAYTAVEGALLTVSLSNPAAPAVVGGVGLAGVAREVRAKGSFAYVLAGDKLQVINIANPTTPFVVGDLSVNGIALAVDGALASVIEGNKLRVVDVSDGELPTIIADVDIDGYGRGDQAVVATGSYAYVAPKIYNENGDATLHAISLSSLGAVPVIGRLPGVGGIVKPQGTKAYVLGAELKIIDVSVPTTPTLSGSLALPGSNVAIDVSGSHAYVATDWQYPLPGRLQVVDVSNSSAPQLVGGVDIGDPSEVAVRGSYAFIGGSAGLQVIDVSQPNAPEVIRETNVGNVTHMALSDDLVYMYTNGWTGGGGNPSLWILSVYNPEYPGFEWQGEDWYGMTGLAVNGSFMFRSDAPPDDPATLQIIDVSTPDSPAWLSSINLPRSGQLNASGDYLYLNYNGSARVIDVTAPSTPKFVGEIGHCGPNVVVAGQYLYTADGTFYVLPAPCREAAAGISDVPGTHPLDFSAFPNPFNPATTLQYSVSSAGPVTIQIFDVQGRRVASILNRAYRATGAHTASWDGMTERGLQAASGVYFVRIEQEGYVATKKISLVK